MLLNRFMVEPSFGFWVLAKTFIPNQGSTFQKLIWTGVIFQYDSSWINQPGSIAISFSLPLRKEPYADDLARPFFANLLPDAEIRKVISRRLGISEKNDFVLLKSIGGECAGAVSVLPEGNYPQDKPGYRELNESELHIIVAELPRKPLMAGEKGIRLSLAGAQNKLPIYMENDKIFLSMGNLPSTHILKPPIQGLEGTVMNEAYCMLLARKVGLDVPEVIIRRGADTLFIVKRFDRVRNPDDKVIRIHQEDFCQALGFLPEQKYESEGGPSLTRCFDLINMSSICPAVDRMALLKWVIFNVLIGNADAHAKNLTILLANPGPRLAPFYDLLCTKIYEDLTDKLAMKIGGENRLGWLQTKHWKRFADSISIKQSLVLRLLSNMTKTIVPKAEELASEFHNNYGTDSIIERICSDIRKRANKMG
ncbi:MAG: type II toxin-antitoxin system HipA family toxin [Deltaproteobacteria bacterium]|nr:MAG: type II toxin-antitoxin system HipA family toxin [Deltaproteobacteria bacterium]